MSKIFRIHSDGGKNDNTHWFDCQAYGNTEINSIKDPNGAKASKQITSIPSPFARIDLVKTAFAEVVKSGDLDGNTIYHRMVSETFDVAEIFFNFDRLSNQFKIIEWDRQNELTALEKTNPTVADTLKMYLQQDAATYNFDLWQQVYLLQYIGVGCRQMQIVGMTSPCTMFISTANDHSAITDNVILSNNRKPFDLQRTDATGQQTFVPLYQRDDDFVKYIYSFIKNCGHFANLFHELDEYLTLTFDKSLSQSMKNTVMGLNGNAVANYNALTINTTSSVTILGYPFHTHGQQQTVNGSDFELQSNIYKGTPLLVLPCEKGTLYAQWHYVDGPWGTQSHAPYTDSNPLGQRTLPNNSTQHPYLTISDLLEDTIIEIPESSGTNFNRDKYFDGNFSNSRNLVPMLPIKPVFFKYFTTDELLDGFNGQPMITIQPNAAGYRVELRIPVKKGVITYSRLYLHSRDISKNEGEVVKIDSSFAFAMMPLIRFTQEKDAFYRLAMVSDFSVQKAFEMKAYHGATDISSPIVPRNTKVRTNYATQIMPVDKKNVDYIQIISKYTDAQGIIVPRLNKQQTGNVDYSFAIDFGTTTTHIEMRIDGGKAESFSIADDDVQLQCLCDYPQQVDYTFDANIMPTIIGSGNTFSFPMRTALSEPTDIDWTRPISSFANVSPAFIYEKRSVFEYNRIVPNLKWDVNSGERAKQYIDALMMMLRHKVLLGGGTLSNTKIVWFYPISMTPHQRNVFEDVWIEKYQTYFGGDPSNVVSFTESEAPYRAYQAQHTVSNDMLTIDIGGGTTDVVIINDSNIDAITSFRFAADVLYGTGLTDGQGALNGIVDYFRQEIAKLLQSNGKEAMLKILEDLVKVGRSEDIASFLFSLRDNKDVSAIKDKLDFNDILRRDNHFKLVFILFYSAIIYHVAQLMKTKGYTSVRTIAFSGNGSKSLQIISNKPRDLSTLTMHILQLSGITVETLTIDSSDNPKEQTCIGGLQNVNPMDIDTMKNKSVTFRSGNSVFTSNDTYGTISASDKESTISEVNSFLDMITELNKRYSLEDHFGVEKSAIGMINTVCRRDLDEYLDKGIKRKLREVDSTDAVQETLFFYPVIGLLSALTEEIYNNLVGQSDGTVSMPYLYLENYKNGIMREVDRNKAQYRLLKDDSGDEGTFEFCGDVEIALANPDSTFDNVANYMVESMGKSISTTAKGRAKSNGNGYWKVTEKANIKRM